MVRQMSEENQDAYVLFVESPATVWKDAEQFEILCSFAASLAEDLYMEHSLWGTAINDEPLMPVKKLSDLHGFMEQLARL